ncbi:hypothetical protein AB0I54_42325 [Streptomyces sp. NPDC050625]|uniref:hypothetical protein n=1 Tax=Streptomyces sp. NPDC050625 TaxID=3154629 RepID=UPI00343C860A
MTDETDEWQPATAEDLVADAVALGVPKASPRMITDWTEYGLLGAPAFRKSTRHGSDARLYSADQRRLFTEMLKARQRSPLARVPHHTLIRVVLYIWLTDDTVVSDTQARRGWRTWARATRSTAAHRSETARQIVDQFAHPDAPYHQRRKAQLLIEQGEKQRSADWDRLYSALTEVCSPWPAAPGSRIERSIGTPILPFGVREAIATWMLNHKVSRQLAAEAVPEATLVQARAEHRVNWQSYEAQREQFQIQATKPEMFEKPSDLEEQVKQHVAGFLPALGHVLGLDQPTFAEARVLGQR